MIFFNLIGDIQNGVEQLASGGWRLDGGCQDQFLIFICDRVICENPDGFPLIKRINDFIHISKNLFYDKYSYNKSEPE